MQTLFYEEYSPILVMAIVAIVLSVIILGASFLLAVQKPDTEKLSAYECGFDPYEDARNAFDVRFYIVAILLYAKLKTILNIENFESDDNYEGLS